MPDMQSINRLSLGHEQLPERLVVVNVLTKNPDGKVKMARAGKMHSKNS